MTATSIQFSANESDILGLKVGRCNADLLDEQSLMEQILQGRYDICRLKIPAEDEYASLKLHHIGIPFFFSGSIRRYKTRIERYPNGDFLHPEMIFEEYDGTQLDLLRKMIEGTWGEYPIGYYRTPYLQWLVSKESEIDCLFRFYSRQNLKTLHPGNTFMFMKDGDKYVGFFALNIINGNLESHIGGILEPYRKDGYFLDMLRYIKNYCIDHSLPYFLFGARNENAYVQKIFQEQGFKPVGTENVFHLTPMLSFSSKPKIVKDLQVTVSLFHLGISFFEKTFPKKIITTLSYKIWEENRETDTVSAELGFLGTSDTEESYVLNLKNAVQAQQAIFYFKTKAD